MEQKKKKWKGGLSPNFFMYEPKLVCNCQLFNCVVYYFFQLFYFQKYDTLHTSDVFLISYTILATLYNCTVGFATTFDNLGNKKKGNFIKFHK